MFISRGRAKSYWQESSWRLLLFLVLMGGVLIATLSICGKQITVNVDGETYPVYTFANSVEKVLMQSNITLNKNDLVEPPLDVSLNKRQSINVVRVTEEEVLVEEEFPFEVVRQGDDWLAQGIEKVKQEGVNGIKRMVIKKIYHDGVEVASDLVDTKIIKEPQPQIVSVGKRVLVPVVSRSSDVARADIAGTFIAEATAYTYTGNNTATGIRPHRGVVAVDPNVIPLGTRLYVEGYGEGVALDTGGSIKGNRIDVFFTTREEAIGWGRRSVQVQIME